MNDDKLTPLDYVKAFLLLGVIVTIYVVVTNFVVEKFWTLVFKLVDAIWPDKK